MESINASDLTRWLQQQVASLLQTEPQNIDLERPLAEQGLDSVDAVGLTGELEAYLGIDLDPTLAFEYPSLSRLVAYLEQSGLLQA